MKNYFFRSIFPVSAFASLIFASPYCSSGTAASIYRSSHQHHERIRQIEFLESNLKMPHGARSVVEYKRFYLWPKKDGGIVRAVFIFKNSTSGVGLVSPGELPVIDDGGCNVVELRYSLRKKKTLALFCNGVA